MDRCLADADFRKAFSDANQKRFAHDYYDGDDKKAMAAENVKVFAELCPAVHAGIAASEIGPQLPPDWASWMAPEKLERLRYLLASPPAALGRRPDPAALVDIVATVGTAEEATAPTLWERFKAWLRSLLKRPDGSDEPGWFSKWLDENLSLQKPVRLLMYVLLVALIGTIIWILYTEIRSSGLPGLWRKRRARVAEEAAPPAEADRRSLAGASDGDLPSILVNLLVDELRRLGRLQDRLSMTHRELARAASFGAQADGETFRQVVGAAELVRYAAAPPAPGSLRHVIDAGRRLLDSLARQPRGAT